MAWTQADIDKLKAAILSASVMQSMTIAGQQFTFRTVEDMERLLARVQGEVNSGSRVRLAATRKGA